MQTFQLKIFVLFLAVLVELQAAGTGKDALRPRRVHNKLTANHGRLHSHKQSKGTGEELKVPNTAAIKSNGRVLRNTTEETKSKYPLMLKEFGSSGPFSYDYLLGANTYVKSDFDVVFIDYDVEESEFQKYINAGKIVICYVNVGAYEEWRSDEAAFPEKVLGNDYDGWPGERWLDIRNTDILLPIMRERFRAAARKGCQGIDPDNMNGYSVDTGFDLTYDDQIEYNQYISAEIRVLGMMAGLKNDGEQANDLLESSDFAVLESCAVYDECDLFDVFIKNGRPVFAIEYTDEWDESDFVDDVCPQVDKTGMSFILKDMDLGPDYIVSCL